MDTTLTDPLIGALLEQRYRVGERVAKGGMASVYQARDVRLDRIVAVKVMHAPYADDPIFVERFIREAKAAAALNHPNVVAVYDQGVENNLTFLVMELVNGFTLRDMVLNRGKLSPAEAASVMEPILGALSAAHRKNVVHRDVKPENVLISRDGQVKVADFGLARAVEASDKLKTTKGVVMGTVAYVSPEQIMNGASNTRSDVYSAGIVLYELLTGSPPFSGASTVNIAFQHVHHDVPAPASVVPDIPHKLNELVVAATRRDSEQRPRDAGELLALLREAREDAGLPVVGLGEFDESPTQHATDVLLQASATDLDRTNLIPRNGQGAAHNGNVPTQQMGSVSSPPAQATTVLSAQTNNDRPSSHRHHTSELPRTPVLIAGVLVLALLAGLVGWWLMSPDTTVTPNVVNLTKQQAEEKTDKVGLSITFLSEEHSETVKPGRVIRQNPDANDEIDEGSAVRVVISKGPERHEVPELAGKNESEAKKALAKAGLKAKITREYDDTAEKGRVVRSDPAAGQAMRPGEYVTIVISKGVEPISVPDVVGQTQADAEAELRNSGLTPNVIYDSSARGAAGDVVAQTPAGGTQAAKGDTITITVAQGISMPNVIGMSMSDAEEQLEELGLRVKKGTGRGRDTVFMQNPAAGTPMRPRDEVTLWAL